MKLSGSPFLYLLGCALLTLTLGGCSFTKTPQKAWSEKTCPASPDYSKLDNWAAHPRKADMADKTPTADLKDNQQNSDIDIFFLHPTTLFGKKDWNGDLSNQQLNRRTENTTIKHQASIFNGTGRVYAPRYRQMVLGGFFDQHDVASNHKAYDIAYSDLKAAFDYYLEHENEGRPIMIVSHSQGSAHAIHLLKDYFDGQPRQSQLVAAYIAGWPVPADTFRALKPCETPSETGCYATWCTFEWGTAPNNPAWYADAVCTNPVTWRNDTLPSAMGDHKGTVMGSYDHIYAGVLETKVHDHILWAKRPDIKGTGIIRSNNFHIADYNLFWLDVRENAQLRARTYLQNVHAGR